MQKDTCTSCDVILLSRQICTQYHDRNYALIQEINPNDLPNEKDLPKRGISLVFEGLSSGKPTAIYVMVNKIVTCSCSRIPEAFSVFFASHYLWGMHYMEASSKTMTFIQK